MPGRARPTPLRRTGNGAFDSRVALGGFHGWARPSVLQAVDREDQTLERSLTLAARAPLDAGPLLSFLGDRAIPGVEEVRGSTYRRTLATPFGAAVVSVTPSPSRDRVRLDATLEDGRGLAPAVEAARRLFDLDADPPAVDRTLRRDPLLRPLVRTHPGVRVPGAAGGFELVVRAILGQQVSVRGARTMLGRVAARFGSQVANGDSSVGTLFPAADDLVAARLEELGITRGRAGAIRRVAALVAGGRLDLTGSGDPDEVVARLLEVDGIGPWTATYVRMRALRDPDAFPATDLGVRRALERLGIDPTPRSIAERAETWRPWRAYAVMLLWQMEAAATSPRRPRTP